MDYTTFYNKTCPPTPISPQGAVSLIKTVNAETNKTVVANQLLITPTLTTTILTNLQRGNVRQQQNDTYIPQRTIHELAAQGELCDRSIGQSGQIDSIIELIDENGFTPLIWAASHGQLATVRFLLARGANPNHKSKPENRTALLFAASNGYVHVIRELLNHGADVDDYDDKGITALMYAVHENHILCVQELLSACADPIRDNFSGESAYSLALANNNIQAQALIEEYLVITLTTPVQKFKFQNRNSVLEM